MRCGMDCGALSEANPTYRLLDPGCKMIASLCGVSFSLWTREHSAEHLTLSTKATELFVPPQELEAVPALGGPQLTPFSRFFAASLTVTSHVYGYGLQMQNVFPNDNLYEYKCSCHDQTVTVTCICSFMWVDNSCSFLLPLIPYFLPSSSS